ncbi:MAG: hypothetical protein AAGA54_13925 [Myxococcota bacterium]
MRAGDAVVVAVPARIMLADGEFVSFAFADGVLPADASLRLPHTDFDGWTIRAVWGQPLDGGVVVHAQIVAEDCTAEDPNDCAGTRYVEAMTVVRDDPSA